MRDISDLIDKNATPPNTEPTLDELNQAEYLAALARFRDFRAPKDRTLWPKPVEPKWKN